MAPRTILLKGAEYTIRKEMDAAGAITPGHLVMRDANGEAAVHNVEAGNAAKQFAIENELFGKTIDDNYAAGDRVLIACPPPGAEIFALVAAGAPAIVTGDYLVSAGDGTLQEVEAAAATSQAQRAGIIARALEDVDNSGGGSPARIMVELL